MADQLIGCKWHVVLRYLDLLSNRMGIQDS